jgi:predicted HTH domain antitoxin
MDITLEVPDQYLIDHDPVELAKHIKLYAAVLMFQSEELSAGAAADLAGVDRFTFAAECQKHGVPLVNYPVNELRAELAALRTEV